MNASDVLTMFTPWFAVFLQNRGAVGEGTERFRTRDPPPAVKCSTELTELVDNLPTTTQPTPTTPDHWIAARHRSIIQIDLEDLRWYEWIDLFRALVHDTDLGEGEKLAILMKKLKDQCALTVIGIGGGEYADREALSRLKSQYGRCGEIRIAHLKAIDRLEPGRGVGPFRISAQRKPKPPIRAESGG